MTNQYPRGKFSEHDEGELTIKMGVKDNTFIIDFGKPVAWIGMSKDQAIDFARSIMRHCVDRVVTVETVNDIQ